MHNIYCIYVYYYLHVGPVTPLTDSFILEPPQKYPWDSNFTAAFRISKLFLHHGIEVVRGDARWDRRLLCAWRFPFVPGKHVEKGSEMDAAKNIYIYVKMRNPNP